VEQNKSIRGFAIKTFRRRLLKENYIHEIRANRRLRQHERIVPLLTAFKHRGNFHLITPWASGGSLADLLQKYETRLDLYEQEHEEPKQLATWYATPIVSVMPPGLIYCFHQGRTS
jgi:serine/threonine protein kinase